jgi:outer membrane protein assembly factor BamB
VREPFRQQFRLTTTPIEHRGRALVLDSAANLYAVDPATGHGTPLGRPAVASAATVRLDPVVAGDTLLVLAGTTLSATSLNGGQVAWQVAGGTPYRPPTVTDGRVCWLSWQGEDTPGGRAGLLQSLDLQTGERRWQQPLGDLAIPGGAVVSRGSVYTSTPPAAFEAETGRQRWQAAFAESGVGGPAVDEASGMVYVGLAGGSGDDGAVAALDASDGRVRWRTSLEADVLNPLEALWLSGGTVVVPTGSGAVVGLDGVTGAVLWHYTPAVPRLASVTVAQGRVWLVLQNGEVIGLDASSGRVAARFADLQRNLNGVGLAQRPAVIGDRVIVPIGGELLGLKVPDE